MKSAGLLIAALAVTLAACGGSDTEQPEDAFPTTSCADFKGATCVEIAAGDSKGLLDAVNSLEANTTIVLAKGTYALDNQVTIRSAGAHLVGQGIDTTTLDFGEATSQFNGVDVIGDDFLIGDLTVLDAPKDGIRVEDSDGVVFRRIRATWTDAEDSTNGAYGIYPVKSQNVLVEDSRAENASDAGLYVGQCQHVIVRRNVVTGNVAGLEIENTQYADVYENEAFDNTGGIVVFDLPGNPIVGHDIRLRDNNIHDNNLQNFSPGGTVSQIPAGTGTFAMASRRVEITGNTYVNNQSTDIAIISGLVVQGNEADWELVTANLVGDWEGLGLQEGATPGTIVNFASHNILIADNTHEKSGGHVDISRQLGLALKASFPTGSVDSVLYDTIGESSFDPTDASKNSNDNHICVTDATATFASLDLASKEDNPESPILRIPAAPFAPFDCDALDGGPVQAVTLPSGS